MKYYFFLLLISCQSLYAQNNVFPGSGNVGIGTSTPGVKLDIWGQIHSYGVGLGNATLNSSSKNAVNFGMNNHGSLLMSSNLYIDGDDALKVAISSSSLSGTSILMPGNSMANQGSIIFYTNLPAPVTKDMSFTGKASMMIGSSGNVGIGTLSPQEKLSVNGKIRAHELKVENSNWPDFVFHDDYVFPKIEETESYIRKNGHLPGIPTTDEVRRNGVDIGDISAKLLQKIEEMTIYIIELNKSIVELNKRVSQLESK